MDQPASPTDCTGQKDGRIDSNPQPEAKAFWYLLIHTTKILDEEAQNSIFGQDWILRLEIPGGGTGTSGDPDAVNILELPGLPQADPRILCAADKMSDDGNSGSGSITEQNDWAPYNKDTDCWELSGQVDPQLQVLP